MQSLMIRISAVLVAALAAAPIAFAQGGAPHTYDVSTVKPAAPGNGGMNLNWGDSGLKAENATLEWMLTNALHARFDQLSGVPRWAKEKHFDITAKLTETDKATIEKLTYDQHRALMLALLVERFGLKYHVETKEMPTYDLVPAKGGLKLTPVAFPGDKSKTVNDVCDGCTMWGNNDVRAHDIDMPRFAEMLGGQMGRTVHDGTGYTANFDVLLKWAPDVGSKTATEEETALPPLPMALEQGLGLHLVSTRGPVKVYVIDQLEEPTSN